MWNAFKLTIYSLLISSTTIDKARRKCTNDHSLSSTIDILPLECTGSGMCETKKPNNFLQNQFHPSNRRIVTTFGQLSVDAPLLNITICTCYPLSSVKSTIASWRILSNGVTRSSGSDKVIVWRKVSAFESWLTTSSQLPSDNNGFSDIIHFSHVSCVARAAFYHRHAD